MYDFMTTGTLGSWKLDIFSSGTFENQWFVSASFYPILPDLKKLINRSENGIVEWGHNIVTQNY